jgi:hypothetical protein
MTGGTLLIGETVTGLWCPDCALPSRLHATVIVADEDGPAGETVDACTGCLRDFAPGD